MGGICGFVGINDRLLLEKMSHSIRHRGAHEKVFDDKDVGISSRSRDARDGLAANEEGSVWVAFDGEIFNRAELQDTLRSDGCDFSFSPYNPEIVAHLYERFGDSSVCRLQGPFALALWDSRNKLLLLARDRSGEKSVFYAFSKGIFCFASEIKALLCSGLTEKKLNLRGLDYFFSWGHVPAPDTLFDGIKKLAPSYVLMYKNRRMAIRRYWNLDFSKIEYGIDENEWCRKIYNMLLDSVSMQLREGPLGILLGGLDSSVMASLMRKQTMEPLKSFTIYFEDEECNEPYARLVAEWLEIDAYEKTLRAKDLIATIEELVQLFDDLKSDLAPTVPTFLSLKMAREHVKTIFTADGADCVFWSWGWTPAKTLASKLVSRVAQKDRKVEPILKFRGSRKSGASIAEVRNMIKLVLTSLNGETMARTQCAHLPSDLRPIYDEQYYHDDELQELLGRHALANVYSPFLGCTERGDDELTVKTNRMRLMNKEFETIGGWGVERLGDICTCFSLNLRTPFEDFKLKEMAAKIPPDIKQPTEKNDKYIFRKMVLKYSLLPKEVAKQPKWGFGWGLHGLVSNWFKGELKEYAERTITESMPRVKPILRQEAVTKYVRSGKPVQILSILMFMLWYQRFFP